VSVTVIQLVGKFYAAREERGKVSLASLSTLSEEEKKQVAKPLLRSYAAVLVDPPKESSGEG
jgi:hypothetical protein